MIQNAVIEKLRELSGRRTRLLDTLVAPARAAANQMKDAGMIEGTAPLAAVLFQLDAIDQEVAGMFAAEPAQTRDAILFLLTGRPGGGR